MLNEHQLRMMNNQHALQSLNSRVEIPDSDLGIGFAERLAPYSMSLIRISKHEKVIVPRMDEIPIETAMLNAEGHLFNENDFGHDHYIETVLGGI
jgi:hypothetical protein